MAYPDSGLVFTGLVAAALNCNRWLRAWWRGTVYRQYSIGFHQSGSCRRDLGLQIRELDVSGFALQIGGLGVWILEILCIS